jgi:peptidoglycan/LPS O-acetylase OafA/YrhL
MPSTRYIAGLDGLRGLACLAVFGVHVQQMTGIGGKLGPVDVGRLLQNGNTGVCLFFMLSGFLLALPIWSVPSKKAEPRRQGLLAFAARRIGRIVPAYFLCLTVLVVAGRADGAVDIVLHYLFLHNLHEATIYSINDPFWTLAVQAQLYAVFALLMPVLRLLRGSAAVTVLVLLAMIGGTYAAHHELLRWAAAASPWPLPPQVIAPAGAVLHLSVLAHLPHFLLGALTARVFYATRVTADSAALTAEQLQAAARQRTVIFDVLFFLAAAGVLAILSVPAFDDLLRLPPHSKDDAMVGRYNLPYVPLLIAVILLSAPRGYMTRELLEAAPLRLLGVISFGIYVYHLPCLHVMRWLMGKAGADVPSRWGILAAGGLLLSIAVATASYLLIERPVLRRARR